MTQLVPLQAARRPWRDLRRVYDAAGLTVPMAADQLGYERISMTTDAYFGRRIRGTGAADVLQALAG